jgi:type II secretory pathway pseudopilin PulG
MKQRKAFSLIGLVVVVLILGMIVAIAAPRFFQSIDNTVDTKVRMNLAVIRDAIDKYTYENNGAFPGQTDDLPGDVKKYIRGPFPRCRIAQNDGSVHYIAAGTPNYDVGQVVDYIYSKGTGEIIINDNSNTNIEPSLTYDEL